MCYFGVRDLVVRSIRYGEIVNINLVKDKRTKKSKGFCFLAYEDQRSTVLAVDNLNGIKVSMEYATDNFLTPSNYHVNFYQKFLIYFPCLQFQLYNLKHLVFTSKNVCMCILAPEGINDQWYDIDPV